MSLNKHRSKEEIEKVLDKLFGHENKEKIDKRFFSMTYSKGLEEALKWVIGEVDEIEGVTDE